MKLKIFASILMGSALMAVSAPAVAQEYEWTFQTSAQAGDNFFPMQQAWAKSVGEASDGRIEITVVPVGTVVAHNETLDAVGARHPAGSHNRSVLFLWQGSGIRHAWQSRRCLVSA